MKYHTFLFRFKSGLLIGRSKISTVSRRSRSFVFEVCDVHEDGWSCSGRLSRYGTGCMSKTSSKFYQTFMLPCTSISGSLQFKGNAPQYHDESISVDTGRMENLTGTLFDALRVHPIPDEDTSYCPFGGIEGFNQCLQLSYPPPKSLPHAIIELWSSLSWLSGGNTASQTQQTVEISGPLFRNYWLDYHESWQKLSTSVNFDV